MRSVLLLALAAPLHAQEPYDLVVRHAKLVDGTGNPWVYADVGVRGDKVVAVGRVVGPAKRELDAKGLVVAPGFIDIHSHSDTLLLEDGNAPSKVRQGVTTEVLGEGNSAGPYTGATKADGRGRFETLGAYFAAVEKSGIAVNVASYVGLDNVWQSVMGASHARPTPEQFARMKEVLDAAMADGAIGLSTMLMMPPGSLATTDDLVELCKVVAKHGGSYSSHVRNEGDGVFDSVKEAIAIGERAGVPVDVIHLKIADQKYWGRMGEVVALIEAARRRGVNVQANVYPYTRGNNNLASIIPPWAHEGGTGKMLERLKDPKRRERLKTDITKGIPGWYNHYTAVGRDWSRMLVSGKGSYEGLTVDRVFAGRGKDKDPLDQLFDLLIETDGSVPTVFEHHTDKDMTLALKQPWCSIGSDGSAYATEGPLRRGNPHPRNFGTFPRALGVYVREKGVLTLEEAVRKMTSWPATRMRLANRGLIKEGQWADVTIFDLDALQDRATYDEPMLFAKGIDYVLVNGVVTIDHEKHTGAKAGKVLYGPGKN
jgi:N-acyl-D-amino-acid deacylase